MHVTTTLVLPYAYDGPLASGVIRHTADDFSVDEELGFLLSGEGEHVYLQFEKRDTNTAWLARVIASHAGVKTRDVGYAGLKDKRAVTKQWFSVYLPSQKEPDWQILQSEKIRLLACMRHKAKLRRGAIRANHFRLTVRNFHVDRHLLAARIESIKQHGVPNYFTEQRFGRDNANIRQAGELFDGHIKLKDRQKRGLLYSAARSWLFNQLLAKRVNDQNWNKALPGDVMMLAGSKRYFTTSNERPEDLQHRIDEQDIHPSGVLWGKGNLETARDAQQIELQVAKDYGKLAKGLERAGIKQARRSLRVIPVNLQHEYDDNTSVLTLCFALESGAYATAVLREIVAYAVPSVADRA
jgi:tRNA pseudouridine13 synthase